QRFQTGDDFKIEAPTMGGGAGLESAEHRSGDILDREVRHRGLLCIQSGTKTEPLRDRQNSLERPGASMPTGASSAKGSEREHALARRLRVEEPVGFVRLLQAEAMRQQASERDSAIGDEARALRLAHAREGPRGVDR